MADYIVQTKLGDSLYSGLAYIANPPTSNNSGITPPTVNKISPAAYRQPDGGTGELIRATIVRNDSICGGNKLGFDVSIAFTAYELQDYTWIHNGQIVGWDSAYPNGYRGGICFGGIYWSPEWTLACELTDVQGNKVTVSLPEGWTL